MTDLKGNVVPFTAEGEAIVTRTTAIFKRATATLDDLERRITIVEAATKPPGATWQ